MRISSKMAKALNNQIAYEASATFSYLAIASWCEKTGYEGSGAFFFEQANEENQHMLKFIHYLNAVGAGAIIPSIKAPINKFNSLEATFKAGLKSEKHVTSLITKLVELAQKEKDQSTFSFLQWFVNEQIEEETLFETILQKFDLIGRDKLAIYQIDQSVASIRAQIMASDTGQNPPAN